MVDLKSEELEAINGGVCVWKIAGGNLQIAGGIGFIIVTKGVGTVGGAMGIAAGIEAIGDGLND